MTMLITSEKVHSLSPHRTLEEIIEVTSLMSLYECYSVESINKLALVDDSDHACTWSSLFSQGDNQSC